MRAYQTPDEIVLAVFGALIGQSVFVRQIIEILPEILRNDIRQRPPKRLASPDAFSQPQWAMGAR